MKGWNLTDALSGLLDSTALNSILVVTLMTSTYQAHGTHRLTLPRHLRETSSVRFLCGKKRTLQKATPEREKKKTHNEPKSVES